jgi:hypothetical protein
MEIYSIASIEGHIVLHLHRLRVGDIHDLSMQQSLAPVVFLFGIGAALFVAYEAGRRQGQAARRSIGVQCAIGSGKKQNKEKKAGEPRKVTTQEKRSAKKLFKEEVSLATIACAH